MLIKLSKMFLCLMLACTMSFTMGCGGGEATPTPSETSTDEGSDEGSSDDDTSSEDDTDDSSTE